MGGMKSASSSGRIPEICEASGNLEVVPSSLQVLISA